MVVDTLTLTRRGGRLLVADNPAAEATVRLRELLAERPDHGPSTAPITGAKRKRRRAMAHIAVRMTRRLCRAVATVFGCRCEGISKS